MADDDDDAAAVAIVNAVRHTILVLSTVAAVAFHVRSLDRTTLLSVNSVPRIVFLLE